MYLGVHLNCHLNVSMNLDNIFNLFLNLSNRDSEPLFYVVMVKPGLKSKYSKFLTPE